MKIKYPTYRQISWPLAIPQLLAIVFLLFLTNLILGANNPYKLMLGVGIYLAYSFSSRQIILGEHRRGMRLLQKHNFQDAIRCFEKSYTFFQKHSWIDKFRSIVLMSCSLMSYREMALINLAFCYVQIGNGGEAKKYYQQALKEFPKSVMANVALSFIQTFEKNKNS